MAKKDKDQSRANRPAALLPKGLRDVAAGEVRGLERMLATIRSVYESYGFEPIDTPAFEYTDALGKFLPDQDRPNEGVFSFQDEDGRWLSLRYDLTAPLARYTAEHFDRLPKPFRRYASGLVFRNEKPGPGRYRQFMQFDADTVGTESMAADAEICMLAADTMERLGVPRGQYLIKVSNRKVLDGVMEAAGLAGDANFGKRLVVLRAVDKLDKFGLAGVRHLLGEGRKDESGDFTKGAGLSTEQTDRIIAFLTTRFGASSPEIEAALSASGESPDFHRGGIDPLASSETMSFSAWREAVGQSSTGQAGVRELEEISKLVRSAGYQSGRIAFDAGVVRGLEYYTGPVFEAELTFETKNEDGQVVRFGSVGGGGRYDDLVARFTGQRVPATGFSIGVSRLQAALAHLGKLDAAGDVGPVVVLVMEKDQLASYQRLTQTLRRAGIRAEMYLGSSSMKAQMKYADKRGAPCVVIQGGDERAKGEVTLKDLIEGAKAAAAIKGHDQWREARPAQIAVPEARLVEAVNDILARHTPASR